MLRKFPELRFAIGAVLLVVSGCARDARPTSPAERSFLIPEAHFDRPPRDVSATEAIADVDVAIRAFHEAYAGLDGLSRTPPEHAVRRTKERLGERGSWAPRGLMLELVRLLGRPDGHLSFGYGGPEPLRVFASPRREPRLSDALFERIGSSMWFGDSQLVSCNVGGPLEEAFVRSASGLFRLGVFDGRAGSASCRVANPTGVAAEVDVPLRGSDASLGDSGAIPARALVTRSPATTGGHAVELYREPVFGGDTSIVVLAIRTFDSAAEAELAVLPAVGESLRKERAFVVDLRGNAGGNYGFAERFVLSLTDRTLQRLDEREVLSVAAAEGRANSARRRLHRGEVPRSAEPLFRTHLAALEREADAMRDRGPGARDDRVTRGRAVRGTGRGPLRGRAVFLVDGGCASACEMALALARQIPGVVLAGHNTRGGMAVGELALFELPHSALTILLGTRAFRDPSGKFAETRGFLPDVWLDGRDALRGAVDLASGTNRKGQARSARAVLGESPTPSQGAPASTNLPGFAR
jgi:hypothetical protein